MTEIVLTFLSGVIVTIVGGILTNALYERLKNRIVVRRISTNSDDDLDGFLDLYERLFPENERSTPDTFVRWLDEYRNTPRVSLSGNMFYLIIAKLGKQVVGTLSFDYRAKNGFVFINFIGVDKHVLPEHENERRFISSTLLKRFDAIIGKECKDAKAIFFEIDAPNPKLGRADNRAAIAKVFLYKEWARKRGYTLYRVPIQYVFPKLSVDEELAYQEDNKQLLFIPYRRHGGPSAVYISKQQLLTILESVYLEWYGTSYMTDHRMQKQYQDYLVSIVKRYIETLPEMSRLERC